MRITDKELPKNDGSSERISSQLPQQPNGTNEKNEKNELIKYDKLEMKNGSKLVLTTNDTQLVDAIRQFMEFQAGQHQGH